MNLEKIFQEYNRKISTIVHAKFLSGKGISALSESQNEKIQRVTQDTVREIAQYFSANKKDSQSSSELIYYIGLLKLRAKSHEEQSQKLDHLLKALELNLKIFAQGYLASSDKKHLAGFDEVKDLQRLEGIFNFLVNLADFLQKIGENWQEEKARGLNINPEQFSAALRLCNNLRFQIATSLASDKESIVFPYLLYSSETNQYPDGYESLRIEEGLHYLGSHLDFLEEHLGVSLIDQQNLVDKFEIMHKTLTESLNVALNKNFDNKNAKTWQAAFFMLGHGLQVCRKISYSADLNPSAHFEIAGRFQNKDWRDKGYAVSSGTSCVDVHSTAQETKGIVADAIAMTDSCFAITTDYKDPLATVDEQITNSITGAVAKGLVRIANQYSEMEDFKNNLLSVFMAQSLVANAKGNNEINNVHVIGGLVKKFSQADGTSKIVAASKGNGFILLAIDSEAQKISIILEAREYQELKAINQVGKQISKEEYKSGLQATECDLASGSILLAFTRGMWPVFDMQTVSAKDLQGLDYQSTAPSTESVTNLFKELFLKNPFPSSEEIRAFLLKKLAAITEARKIPPNLDAAQSTRNIIIQFASYCEGFRNEMWEDDNVLKPFLATLSTQDYFAWLDKDGVKQQRPYQVESISLLTLYEDTYRDQVGGDASLLVQVVGKSKFLAECEEILAFIETYKPGKGLEKDFKFNLEQFQERLEHIFRYMKDSMDERFVAQIIGFINCKYVSLKVTKPMVDWIYTQRVNKLTKEATLLIEKLHRTLSMPQVNVSHAARQAKDILGFCFTHQDNGLSARQLNFTIPVMKFFMALELGMAAAGAFFPGLSYNLNSLELDQSVESSLTEQCIKAQKNIINQYRVLQSFKLEEFSTYFKPLHQVSEEVLQEDANRIKFYLIIEESINLLRAIYEELPENFQRPLKAILKSNPDTFLEKCRTIGEKCIVAATESRVSSQVNFGVDASLDQGGPSHSQSVLYVRDQELFDFGVNLEKLANDFYKEASNFFTQVVTLWVDNNQKRLEAEKSKGCSIC